MAVPNIARPVAPWSQRNDGLTLYVRLTPAEMVVISELRRREGVFSWAELLRHALWSLCDDMGIEVPDTLLDRRAAGVPRKSKGFTS